MTAEGHAPLHRVCIDSDGRKVTVATTENVPIAALLADALTVWTKAKPRRQPAEAPGLEAGGFGFQAELAPQLGGGGCPEVV